MSFLRSDTNYRTLSLLTPPPLSLCLPSLSLSSQRQVYYYQSSLPSVPPHSLLTFTHNAIPINTYPIDPNIYRTHYSIHSSVYSSYIDSMR